MRSLERCSLIHAKNQLGLKGNTTACLSCGESVCPSACVCVRACVRVCESISVSLFLGGWGNIGQATQAGALRSPPLASLMQSTQQATIQLRASSLLLKSYAVLCHLDTVHFFGLLQWFDR